MVVGTLAFLAGEGVVTPAIVLSPRKSAGTALLRTVP
jgi:hypothetical protein